MATAPVLVILQLMTLGAGALLLVGLWTPVAGVLMAAAELCLAYSTPADPWMRIYSDGSAFVFRSGRFASHYTS